jgi:hypothetical protein
MHKQNARQYVIPKNSLLDFGPSVLPQHPITGKNAVCGEAQLRIATLGKLCPAVDVGTRLPGRSPHGQVPQRCLEELLPDRRVGAQSAL